MRKPFVALAALAALSAGTMTFGAATAQAAAICVAPAGLPADCGDGLSLRLNDNSTNDLGFTPGLEIILGADSVTPNGDAGTTVTAQPTNLSIGPQVIPFLPLTTVPNQFEQVFPDEANLTVPWTVNFTNGATTLTLTTPSLVGVTPAPFATNVTVSGSGLNPTFSWTYPAGIDGVDVLLYDKAALVDGGTPDLVWSESVSGTTGSLTLPTTLQGGYTLTPGTPYAVVLKAEVLRDPNGPLDNPNIAAQSDSYFDLTPTTSPYTEPVYLPMVNPTTGAYMYDMTVAAGTEYFIDPEIAVGYAYQSGAGNPNFASVQLPDIQANSFDLAYLESGAWLTTLVAPGSTFDFPDGGVSSFDVTGIDPSLTLDPGDTTAFLTGLTFTANGSFTGTQTPLTEDVPEPSSILLFGSALAGLLVIRRRRAAV